jgi:Flp pilus assembly protein TadD
MIPLATALLAVALGAGPSQDEKPGGDAHLGRATQLVREQLYEAAAGEYEAALTSRPNDPRIHLQYAVCLLNLGRNEEARKEFEKVRDMAGESRYVTYYLGRIDLLANDYESAIKRLGAHSIWAWHTRLSETTRRRSSGSNKRLRRCRATIGFITGWRGRIRAPGASKTRGVSMGCTTVC